MEVLWLEDNVTCNACSHLHTEICQYCIVLYLNWSNQHIWKHSYKGANNPKEIKLTDKHKERIEMDKTAEQFIESYI